MLVTLRYADELRAASGFELPSARPESAGVTPRKSISPSAWSTT